MSKLRTNHFGTYNHRLVSELRAGNDLYAEEPAVELHPTMRPVEVEHAKPIDWIEYNYKFLDLPNLVYRAFDGEVKMLLENPTSRSANERRLHLYRDGHPYTMGHATHADEREDKSNGLCTEFNVHCPHINNKKFMQYAGAGKKKPSGRKFFSKCTNSKHKALGLIKDLFVPYTPKEVMMASMQKMSKVRQTLVGEYIRKVTPTQKVFGELATVPTNPVFAELTHAHKNGLFASQEFADGFSVYLNAEEVARKCKEETKVGRWIWRDKSIEEDPIHWTYRTTSLSTDDHKCWSGDMDVEPEILEYVTQDSDEIMGKMAMLSMCESDDYVEDVGFRISEDLFYVQG